METNSGKMIIGVIIGIMAALTLTLNIWGLEWYKIVISTATGIIIGLLISDYQTTVAIFKTGLQIAIDNSWKKAQRIKNGKMSKEQRHNFDISIIKSLYVLLMQLLAIILFGIFFAITSYFKLFKTGQYVLLIIALVFLFIRIYYLIINSFDFDTWTKKLNSLQVRKIWDKEPSNHGKNSLTYDYLNKKKIGFKDLTIQMNFGQIIKKSWMSAKIVLKKSLKNDWGYIKKSFKITLIIILTIILLITTSLPILPFWIIKQISQHGRLLNVSAAITTGSLIGSLTNSKLIGVSIGLGFLIISYLIEKLFKKINLFYMMEKDGIISKLADYV